MSEQVDHVVAMSAPSVAEYRRLRAESGLTPRSEEQAHGAVTGSWSWCHVRDADGEAVAMGRVIGDGGWYFHVADMATLPDHQGRGLGRMVLQHLLDDVVARAPASPYVTLMADGPGRRLYTAMGFVETAPRSLGMHLPPERLTQP